MLDDLRRRLGDKYEIVRELGRGGMGAVLLAHDRALDRPVALKVLPPGFTSQPDLHDRFLRETRLAAGLSHPDIVSVFSIEDRDRLLAYAIRQRASPGGHRRAALRAHLAQRYHRPHGDPRGGRRRAIPGAIAFVIGALLLATDPYRRPLLQRAGNVLLASALGWWLLRAGSTAPASSVPSRPGDSAPTSRAPTPAPARARAPDDDVAARLARLESRLEALERERVAP